MTFTPTPLLLALLLGLSQSACQPQKLEQGQASTASTESQAQLDAIKAELSQIKIELKQVSSQVEEIHTIATASTRPTTRKLPNLSEQELSLHTPSLGDPQAQLAIVEFSDFQCPYCKRFLDTTFSQLKQTYIDSGKVQYLVKNFPLTFHANAEPAAIAAYCAGEQGAYWPMRDKLFANMTVLNDGLYTQLANELKLDMKQFNHCQTAVETKAQIAADRALGSKLGVQGTPSFVIGTLKDKQLLAPELLVGAQDFNAFSAVITSIQSKP
ncbi:MAG: DsbA family protein [Shewanella sp.]|uniref:DsbA family protein n=1 Tax=Shewanella sp. TaxID=50422 RepID=UPI003F2D8ED8